MSTNKNRERLIPISKWPEFHPWPSKNGLRWLIFNEEINGFHNVICRVGRNVLIKEDAFFKWAEAEGKKSKKEGHKALPRRAEYYRVKPPAR